MSDFPHDPARPFVVVKEWPGGRKHGLLFATEEEASKRAVRQAIYAGRGTTIHLCYSGQPQRVIQQWQGGHCPGCGMADEDCLCDHGCEGCGDDARVCGCSE